MLNNNITIDIAFAAKQLRAGELVAFPTETVYGLGADAGNPAALQKVFALKGRPADHPVIVHIGSVDQLTTWARDIPDTAWTLATQFWPGPLTLLLRKQDHVSDLITGGQETIGMRIPNHPLTLALLQEFGSAIVGPSANKYGRVSPTNPLHVFADLGTEVSVILDGGDCNIGIESTIIDLTAPQPTIMRSGVISADQIAKVLQQDVLINNNQQNKTRTSGSHISHYAPRTPVQLVDSNELLAAVEFYLQQQKSCSVISFAARPENLAPEVVWQQVSNDPAEYAHDLYANLRQHDLFGNATILIEQPPRDQLWFAILDRLARASARDPGYYAAEPAPAGTTWM